MAVMMRQTKPRSGQRRATHLPPEINVTPLVDVMLVLLVIFMVTAPLLTVGVTVDLPKTNASPLNEQDEPLTITVDTTGTVYLQETPLDLTALIPRLIAITGSNLNARIYVRGDKNVPYGKIMEVMGSVNTAGFTKVALLTEAPSGPGVKAGGAPEQNAPITVKKSPSQPRK